MSRCAFCASICHRRSRPHGTTSRINVVVASSSFLLQPRDCVGDEFGRVYAPG